MSNSDMSVLHTEWSDGWGGQEIRIINEMIALREKGVELFLACRENAIIKNKAQEAGFRVFTLPFNGNTDIKTLFGLIKIIKKEKIDIVNTHSGKDTWVGGIAAKISGAKFIRTRHLSNRINPSKMNFINSLADFIVTTGESVRDDMTAFNRIEPGKIISIPTGIDETTFDPEKYDKTVCRQMFNLDEDSLIIGIVAVLRQFKRHDVFIEMAKVLLEQYPQKRLLFVIAGEGPQRKNIEKLIDKYALSEKIKLIGHIDKVPEFLKAIDIFTLTSDSKEGVPQSVMQALMMEKAVVATSAGSTRDLLYDDNFLIVDPPNDFDLLVAHVESYIEDENRREQFSSRARETVLRHFSRATMQKNVFNIYHRLLSS